MTENDFSFVDELEDSVEQRPSRANRRKNEWKYAVRRKFIYNVHYSKEHSLWSNKQDKKPLHYYAKNSPWNGYTFAPNKTNNKGSRRYISKNYKDSKNWSEHDRRQLDSFENQIEELFDNE